MDVCQEEVDERGGSTFKQERQPPASFPTRCRANMAHIRRSGPDYGLSFQANVLDFVKEVQRADDMPPCTQPRFPQRHFLGVHPRVKSLRLRYITV